MSKQQVCETEKKSSRVLTPRGKFVEVSKLRQVLRSVLTVSVQSPCMNGRVCIF